ncbi:hypothetical protein BsWGS_15399 [Bradybaena similaris]
MNESSVVDLIGQLCDIHLGPAQRAFRVQPTISRSKIQKCLKQKAFNALFQFLNSADRECAEVQNRKDVDGILLEIFKMRIQRQFENADRLESLFNALRSDCSLDIGDVLKFIIALKGTGDESQSEQSRAGVFNIPGPKELRKEPTVYPEGPLCYGDIRQLSKSSQFYMHYPNDLFERPFISVADMDTIAVQTILDLSPGTGLGSDRFFTTKFLLNDSHEQTTHNSLFGGLMHGRVRDLGTQLSLPDLSSDLNIRIPEFKCKKSSSMSQMSVESGLGSGSASMSSSVITVGDTSDYEDSIWDRALTEPRSKHYTWEWIGYSPGPTEKPYLTEAGPSVFDILVQLRRRVSAILSSEARVPQLITVESTVLLQHILLMLTGIPSLLFPFNQETYSFSVTEGLHVSGTSPEMLSNFLSEFVECGTHFARLTHFSQPPVLNSFYTGGLVFQAFAKAIRKFLSHFTAAVLKIPTELPLLKLNVCMRKAMEQIRYIATLCHCCSNTPSATALRDFPTGMKLLTYLYDEADVSSGSAHYPLLLSILQTSFAPFVLFIRDWVFHGVHRDFYDEFMIQVDIDCMEARDETYWSKAYTLVSDRADEQGVPHFLRESVQDIVTCGKSINLLRICNQQHFMCSVSESDIPSLSVTFSYEELKAIETYCQIYEGRMKQVAQHYTDDRQDFLRRVEQQRIELQQTARRVADHEIARLQGVIDERKKKAKVKKEAEFHRLKEQMEEDLKRRAGEQEQSKEEDRNFMARLLRKDHALTEEEIELEKKARDDLIAYYTELGEEAMHRERRALWRVRRAQLETSRVLFLTEDAERWRQEMAEHLHAKDLLDTTSQSLPSWASKQADTPTLVSGEEELALPVWVQRGSSFSEQVNIEPLENSQLLPKWALRDSQPSKIQANEDTLDDVSVGADAQTENNGPICGILEDVDKPVSQTENALLHGPHLDTTSGAENTEQPSAGQTYPEVCSMDAIGTEEHTKSSIRMVQGVSAATETTEAQDIRHTKSNPTMFASKESDPDKEKKTRYVKFQDVCVSDETSEERQMIPKMGKSLTSQSASQESESKVWIIKKPSTFGHISQLSNSEYILTVPKLRRQSLQHANMESDFKDFSIKPCIRMNKTMSATTESESSSAPVPLQPRTHVKVLSNRNASSESQRVDENVLAVQRFRAHNVQGHSSDSTVQHLLYGNAKTAPDSLTAEPFQKMEIQPGIPYQVEMFETEFLDLDSEPFMDVMSHISVADLGRDLVDAVVSSEEKVEAYKYTPLSVLLTRSIMAPVRAQIALMNSALVNYFTAELKVDSHFEAIRRYLLMADGDFAEILSNILLEKMLKSPKPQDTLNPLFLNGALNKAIRSSIHSNDANTGNLSFVLKDVPSVFLPNAPNSLNCLQLIYSVSWPLNIILTSACMKKYCHIFTFLLQIKRVVWTLKDIWHRLKRDAVVNKAGNSAQFRPLQLHRQEMEHFVKMMQGYITNQVILVSWQEFQTTLSQPIAGLNQLQFLHEQYVNRAISRCLLDKKAEKVMKIIQDIFSLILKFRSQLVSSSWERNGPVGEVVHPNFAGLVNTYRSFHMYSFFLFRVVYRLSQKSYQPHLQELLLQLNFNDYYSEAAN